LLTPRTLPVGADEAGGPPLKVLRDLGQPRSEMLCRLGTACLCRRVHLLGRDRFSACLSFLERGADPLKRRGNLIVRSCSRASHDRLDRRGCQGSDDRSGDAAVAWMGWPKAKPLRSRAASDRPICSALSTRTAVAKGDRSGLRSELTLRGRVPNGVPTERNSQN
jgi:hypothetical protein